MQPQQTQPSAYADYYAPSIFLQPPPTAIVMPPANQAATSVMPPPSLPLSFANFMLSLSPTAAASPASPKGNKKKGAAAANSGKKKPSNNNTDDDPMIIDSRGPAASKPRKPNSGKPASSEATPMVTSPSPERGPHTAAAVLLLGGDAGAKTNTPLKAKPTPPKPAHETKRKPTPKNHQDDQDSAMIVEDTFNIFMLMRASPPFHAPAFVDRSASPPSPMDHEPNPLAILSDDEESTTTTAA